MGGQLQGGYTRPLNGYHRLQELEHCLGLHLEEFACDPAHTFKMAFAKQAGSC
jgi:hypothetical protein